MKRLVFDIETEPFSSEFFNAETNATRKKHAPRLRVACVYDEETGEHQFFEPDKAEELVEALQAADEIVSFNGKRFDLLVLRRHHLLKGKVPLKGKHVDLHEILSVRAGFRVSLDKVVKLNFKETKHTGGRDMMSLDVEALKVACRSDVDQTYRLWLKYKNGTIKVPQRTTRRYAVTIECNGPGHHMPELMCPSCHDVGCLEFVDWDTSDMTDGQLAEYLAGTQGGAECQTCGYYMDWFV